jgi:hypothetical protein
MNFKSSFLFSIPTDHLPDHTWRTYQYSIPHLDAKLELGAIQHYVLADLYAWLEDHSYANNAATIHMAVIVNYETSFIVEKTLKVAHNSIYNDTRFK